LVQFTVKLNVVEWVRVPEVAVTVRVKTPAGVPRWGTPLQLVAVKSAIAARVQASLRAPWRRASQKRKRTIVKAVQAPSPPG
jgi:hypothetical protein